MGAQVCESKYPPSLHLGPKAKKSDRLLWFRKKVATVAQGTFRKYANSDGEVS